jgi:hypothetical protein
MDPRLTFVALAWVILCGFAVFFYFRGDSISGARFSVFSGAFFMIFAIALTAWRWRSLTYAGEINVDESQLLAQLLRYKLDPVPWRSVDGGSSGPLNTWVVLWAPFFGVKIGYLAARLTSLACILVMNGSLMVAFSRLIPRRTLLLVSMIPMTFFLTSLNFDFAFFSSEQLPGAISAVILCIMIWGAFKPSKCGSCAIGFLSGALPFCKIQFGPSSIVLFGVSLAVTISASRDRGETYSRLLWQCIGGLSVPAMILVPVYAAGAWNDFVFGYLKSMLLYKSNIQIDYIANVKGFIFGVPEFGVLVAASFVALLFICGALTAKKWWQEGRTFFVMSVGVVLWLITSIYSVLCTGFPFPHYLMSLVVPSVACIGLAVRLTSERRAQNPTSEGFANVKPLPMACALMVVLGTQVASGIHEMAKQPRLLQDWGDGGSKIGEILRSMVDPDDTILVWGWAPKFHVFSGIAPATRYCHPFMLFPISGLSDAGRDEYLKRYLSDFSKSKPRLFVDAPEEFTLPGYPRGNDGRHWSVHELSELIRQNYTITHRIETGQNKVPILVYKRH